MRDPLCRGLAQQFPIMHWHNDMPGLTKEAAVLATSEGCPRQIIRYAPKIYGFQCHPEPMLKNIEEMMQHCEGDLSPGRFVQSKEMIFRQDFAAINRCMLSILDNLYS